MKKFIVLAWHYEYDRFRISSLQLLRGESLDIPIINHKLIDLYAPRKGNQYR